MTKHCRIAFCFAVICVLTVTVAGGGHAGTYPSKTIVFSTHTNPGGGADILGRHLTEALKGQKINGVIENHTGGSGLVNMAYVASKPGDGYTLGIVTASLLTTRHLTNAALSFKDFKQVAMVQAEELAIVCKVDAKWKTVDELIADLKQNPGKVKVGGGFLGSADSLVVFMLGKKAGFKPAYVPYESGGEITVALLGDQLQVAVNDPKAVLTQGKKLRMLAIAGEKRSEFFPEVPTLKERGYDVVMQQWRGIWAPKSTPDEIVNQAAAFIKTALEAPNFKKYMKDDMLTSIYLGPADFQKAVEEQDKTLSALIDELGLRGSQVKK